MGRNPEVDGLQQHTTTEGSICVIQEQETEARVGTGSSKLDSWRFEKCQANFYPQQESSSRQCDKTEFYNKNPSTSVDETKRVWKSAD